MDFRIGFYKVEEATANPASWTQATLFNQIYSPQSSLDWFFDVFFFEMKSTTVKHHEITILTYPEQKKRVICLEPLSLNIESWPVNLPP